MAAPEGACIFALGFQLWPLAWARHNPINLASFRFCLSFLPIDLWATAKAQLCDTYFMERRIKGCSADPDLLFQGKMQLL